METLGADGVFVVAAWGNGGVFGRGNGDIFDVVRSSFLTSQREGFRVSCVL